MSDECNSFVGESFENIDVSLLDQLTLSNSCWEGSGFLAIDQNLSVESLDKGGICLDCDRRSFRSRSNLGELEEDSELVLDVSKVSKGTSNVQGVPFSIISEQMNISSCCASPPASSLLYNRATIVVGDLFTSLVNTATLFSGLSLSKVLFSANSSPSKDNGSSAAFGWLSLPDALLDEAVALVSIANSLLGAAFSSLLAITKEFQSTSSLASNSDGSVLDCNDLESFLFANLFGVL